MEMGMILHALFIGAEPMRPDKDGNVRWVCALACGATTYRIYLDNGQEQYVTGLAFGQEVFFRVRAFAGKGGAVGYSGSLIQQGA